MLEPLIPATLLVIILGLLLSTRIKSHWLPIALIVPALALPSLFLYYNPPMHAYRPFGMAVCGKCIAFFERLRSVTIVTTFSVADFAYLLILIGLVFISGFTIFFSLAMLRRSVPD